MIQSPGTAIAQSSSGFESLACVGPLTLRERVAVRSDKSSFEAINALTPEQQRQLDQLKQIDRQVRAHEQAHISVGAELVRGGATFTFATGPDQRSYAVAGEVSIDTTPGRTPEETIPKARHIRATALAPADPSLQDHGVAAEASRMEGDARLELAAQQRATNSDSGASSSTVFYRGVERSERDAGRLGSRLDFFA